MGGLGATEILLIILVALLLFGAGRIADIGKGLGEGIRNFKKGLKEDSGGDKSLGSAENGKPFAELGKSEPGADGAAKGERVADRKGSDDSSSS